MINPTTDLSDEAMAVRWGGILNEVPQLWDAIRKFEIENRPTRTPGGFRLSADWVSVQRSSGDVLRIQVGSAGRVK